MWMNKYYFPAETTKWCVMPSYVNCFLIHYQGGRIEECFTKNVLKARLFKSNAEAVDYFTLFYNSLSQICIPVMQDNLCVLSLCACASPWLGTYARVRGKYAKRPFIAFGVFLKLAWAWRERMKDPPQCGWIQTMPLVQVLPPQGSQCFDHSRTGVTFGTPQHSKHIHGTIAGWNASAKANPSRGLFWKIIVKPSKARVLTGRPCAGAVAETCHSHGSVTFTLWLSAAKSVVGADRCDS